MCVSIGLPYTDQGEQLALAVRSVLAQSFEDWELVLIGDNPNEETRTIAHQFADPRIRFYENSSRLGLAATLNRINRLATKPLIARMDGDDVMHPDRIARQKQAFDEDPSIDVLGARAYLIDDESNLVGLFKESDLPTSGAGYFKSNAFTHPTVMATKQWFLANPYNEKLLRGEDKELWLRTWSHSRFAKLPNRLMYYRRPRRIPSARMRRDEAYNRLIMGMYQSYEKSMLSRIRRIASSYVKEGILGVIGACGLSSVLFDTKWVTLENEEYSVAYRTLEATKCSNSLRHPASNTVAATVTYGDRYHFAERTVKAALKAGAAKVIVIDNGSTQTAKSGLECLAMSDSRIAVVRLASNRGSAEGFASAVRSFLQTDADYLWLLDDDNECEADALGELINASKSLAGRAGGRPVAVCAVRPSNPLHAAIARGMSPARVYPPRGSFMYFDLSHRLISLLAKGRMPRRTNEQVVDVPYAPYGGLLVSRESLKVVGTPNSNLGLYEDDTEFTARFSDLGGRLALCRTAIVNDIDAKWTESNGHTGLAGLLHATDSKRIYFAVRNRVSFDVGRSKGAGKSMRLTVNRFIFQVALWVSAVRYGKASQARQIRGAQQHGMQNNFSRSFSDEELFPS